MTNGPATVDTDRVMIVGGGTVGLAAALFLTRQGVAVTVLERRAGPDRHPRALGLHERSLELFRQAGVQDAVDAASVVPRTSVRKASASTVRDWADAGAAVEAGGPHEDWPRLPFGDPAIGAVSAIQMTGSCPQDRLDSVLVTAARSAGSQVRYNAEVVDLDDDGDLVHARLADGTSVSGRYVVLAEGASGSLRERLGVALDGPGPVGSRKVNIVFDADLYGRFGPVPFMLDITTPGAWGMLITVDADRRWMLHVDLDADSPVPGPEQCADLVRAALGDPECTVDVVSAAPWILRAQVARRYRVGRVLLAGDTAHAIPPLGAFGMNLGLADVHNLAWKLGLVLRAGADLELLDTYEAERRPVAQATLHQTMLRLRNPSLHFDRSERGAADRAAVGAWNSPVVSFGYRYTSEAVQDAAPELPSTEVLTHCLDGAPGSRVPHGWLVDARTGEARAVLDLVPAEGMTVFVGLGGGQWTRGLADARPYPLHVIALGVDVLDPHGWADRCGIGTAGVLVVRPDHFVAFRAGATRCADTRLLDAALDAVTATHACTPARTLT